MEQGKIPAMVTPAKVGEYRNRIIRVQMIKVKERTNIDTLVLRQS